MQIDGQNGESCEGEREYGLTGDGKGSVVTYFKKRAFRFQPYSYTLTNALCRSFSPKLEGLGVDFLSRWIVRSYR